MSLPQLDLDDRDFQSLVDEARVRIAHTCPDWNEHNVSDPGITLIELFAWMTDQLVYRVNRIPEKVQIALLDLLGIELAAAEAATAELRFRLAAPTTSHTVILADLGQVGSARDASNGSVLFRLADPIRIPPVRLDALMLGRGGEVSAVPVRAGVARPTGSDRLWFSGAPQPDNALYLGSRSPLAGLVVAVTVAAERARGTGIDPDDPPWSWEVAAGGGAWSPATVLSDQTGGFNYGSGVIELQLPHAEGPDTVGGQRMHWLRCRLGGAGTDEADTVRYTHAPTLREIKFEAIGALAPAHHTTAIEGEILGYSDGSPGQVFAVRRRPALPLEADDGLDMLDPTTKAWVPWTARESFADSGPSDRHYRFDPVEGEVQFGPAIREPGGWVQRGAIPPEGVALRMRRYRHGGGAAGNVAANLLTVLRRPIPGVASVTNPAPAHGGVDPESLEDARRRAAMELRTRFRAVTAEDYEMLACRASRLVARARCVPPEPGEPVGVRILPVVTNPASLVTFEELQPSDDLLSEVADYLDARRTLGTSVHVTPVALRGVTTVAEVALHPTADREAVEGLVAEALYRYLNPYVGASIAGEGDGWGFGRPLQVAEVEVVVREVPGVFAVSMLRVYATDLATGRPEGHPVGDRLEIGPDELVASARHRVRVLAREGA